MPDAFAQLEDQDIDSRVVLDYTSRDFTAIRAQLVGLAKGLMPEWETAGEPADFGTTLLEIFAYMGDVMHFYIDRVASEAFLGSALRQSSVLYIANMLGYTPIGQQSAMVTLQFNLDQNAPDEITIPVGTRVHNTASNADDLIVFETDTEIKLPWVDTAGSKWWQATGYATEGIVQHDQLLGVSLGTPNTELIIPDKGVVHGSVKISTREGFQVVEWAYITDLSLARPTQPVFTVYRDEQDFTHVVFGDNASGRTPPVQAQVYVTYRYGVGAEANLLAPGAINTVINTSDQDWWGLTVTNTSNPLGGADPESVDAMRQSIPRAAGRIKNRAVTLHDYADLALQVPGVAKSEALGSVYTAVRVRIAPTGGQGDDAYITRLCADVERYMEDKVIIGSRVYAEPRTMAELWTNVYIRILVHVQLGYNRTSVRTRVDATVRQTLAFDSVDFCQFVTIGQIYRAALAVEGVEWCEVTWLSANPPPVGLNSATDAVLFNSTWKHDIIITVADPGTGKYRFDHATTPTNIMFSAVDSTAANQVTNLMNLRAGDQIFWRPTANSSWRLLTVTGVPVNTGSIWIRVPVSQPETSDVVTLPPDGTVASFDFKRPALQEIFDIETDDLHIPRIAPETAILTANVSSAGVLTTNVATLTTSVAHKMLVGMTIDVTGVPTNVYNGRFVITGVPSVSTLTYTVTSGVLTNTTTNGLGIITTVNLPESVADYPTLTVEERTHDGLWVIADGGLTGT